MASPIVALRDIEFSWPNAATPLFQALTVTLTPGFTGIVGANGSGKTTLLKLLHGTLQPDAGRIEGNDELVFCEQRTDAPPERLQEFLLDWDSAAFRLRTQLEVVEDAQQRWASLSHGERKRAQIACALWQRPTVLVLDEPANHIDAAARRLLEAALQRFNGIGVLVSHDRELLDALCRQIVWLSPPSAAVFNGNYSTVREERERQQVHAQRERDTLKAQHKKLHAERARRRERADRADAQRSKRGLASGDSDARERINRARLTGKDGTDGRLLRQIEGRAEQSAAALAETRIEKAYATGVWVGGEAARSDTLWTLAAGRLQLGTERTLSYPDLMMRPTDRIAITGPNGAGKSTLLAAIQKVIAIPRDRLVVLPQEVTAQRSSAVLEEVRKLPAARLGSVMSIVSRLGSRPERLLDSREPSPGEVRKLLLALGIARSPFLLVLDEPTNHLDVLAVEALQSALVDCPCGLLVVSHDETLLAALDVVRWRVDWDSGVARQQGRLLIQQE